MAGWTLDSESINLLEGIRIAPTIKMATKYVNTNVTEDTLMHTHSPVP